MSALNIFALCLLTGLLWLSGEFARWEAGARDRAVRTLALGLLAVNILKYALPPIQGGPLVLPVEFSAAAYFTTPALLLTRRRGLRCWAAYAGTLAGACYYAAMVFAGEAIYGAYPEQNVLLSLLCHGCLLLLGLMTARTERVEPRDILLLPLGTAAVAVRAALLRPWSGGGELLIYELMDAEPIRRAAPALLPAYYAGIAALLLLAAACFMGLNKRAARP